MAELEAAMDFPERELESEGVLKKTEQRPGASCGVKVWGPV